VSRGQLIRLSNFSGGEAFIFPQTAMKHKYSLLMQNCYISDRGTIKKVPGYQKLNETSCGVNLTSGFEFKMPNGFTELLVAGGGKIFKFSGGSLVEIYTGLDTSARVNFSSIGNTCIITNGVNAPLKYNGTSITTLGGSPPATSFKTHVHKGRVWFIERNNKMLVSHSALNNPESQEGYIDFQFVLKRGDELVDMFTYIDMHVFMFKNHIAIYSGQTPSGTNSDYRLVQLIEGSGALTTNVTLNVGTDLFFLSAGGVKSLTQVVTTGNLNVGNISTLIDPQFLKDVAEANEFSAAYYPKLNWGLLKVGSKIYIYSYALKAWTRIVGADCNFMFSASDGKLYFCGNGFLYEYGIGRTFAGVNPIMQWDTAWIQLTNFGNKASLKLAEITIYTDKDTTVTLFYAYDVSPFDTMLLIQVKDSNNLTIDGITDWDSIPALELHNTPDAARIPIFGRGRTMQLKFKNDSDADIEIVDIVLQLTQGGL
jgi:hypothetical protein